MNVRKLGNFSDAVDFTDNMMQSYGPLNVLAAVFGLGLLIVMVVKK